MTNQTLQNAKKQIRNKYPHLISLLSPEEIKLFQQEIEENKTPIWRYWEDYVFKTLILGKSPITIKSVRDGLNTIMRHTGILTIEQANTLGVLDQATLELQINRNQKPSTRNTYIKNFNTYFIWLYKNNLIQQNNIARIEKGREAPPDVKPLSLEQIEKTVLHIGRRHHSTALERARNILMIDVFRFSGVRPCELLSMNNDDIFQENGEWRMVINGRKQKGRLRYYELPSFVAHSYQNYMKLRYEKDRFEKPLFISMSSREGWKTSGLQQLFKNISKEIGFRVTAYGFRRFIASQMSRNGIARDDLSRYLGHNRFTTTDRYIARDCHLTRKGTDMMKTVYEV